MPVELAYGHAVVLIRQGAYERAGLVRNAIDLRYNLTDEEFRFEDGLVVLGPLPSPEMLPQLIEDLEGSGMVYCIDIYVLSGSWPEWHAVVVRGSNSLIASI